MPYPVCWWTRPEKVAPSRAKKLLVKLVSHILPRRIGRWLYERQSTLRYVSVLATLTALAVISYSEGPAQATPSKSSSEYIDGLHEPAFTNNTDTDNPRDWFPGNDAAVINVPGTDDLTFEDRTKPLQGTRESYMLNYSESIGPIISGNAEGIGGVIPLFAPTFDESTEQGVGKAMSAWREICGAEATQAQTAPVAKDQEVIWTGYSMGARIIGDTVEQANAEGLVTEQDTVLAVSDPRSPWGIEQELRSAGLSEELAYVGVTPRARDPKDAGDARVVEVVMTSDPIANTTWDSSRPVTSAAVNITGQVLVHGGLSDYSYKNAMNLPAYQDAAVYKSAEGNTTYVVIDTPHPFALAQAELYDAVEVPYTDKDVQQWDQQWNQFYEMSTPTPENAAVDVVPATRADLEEALPAGGEPTGGYAEEMSLADLTAGESEASK